MSLTRDTLLPALLPVLLVLTLPLTAEGQGRGNGQRGEATVSASPSVTLTVDTRGTIRAYYEQHRPASVESLPPGMRNRLARGKPLPPGIAKRSVPSDLRSRIQVPTGYEVVEVGLDVLLVEIATNVVHDVLMDVIRS